MLCKYQRMSLPLGIILSSMFCEGAEGVSSLNPGVKFTQCRRPKTKNDASRILLREQPFDIYGGARIIFSILPF